MTPPATVSPRTVRSVCMAILFGALMLLAIFPPQVLALPPLPLVPEETATPEPVALGPFEPTPSALPPGPSEPAEQPEQEDDAQYPDSFIPLAQIITYTAQEEDTVWSIAVHFNLDIDTLRWSNPDIARDPDHLRYHQVLIILPVKGAYHTVQPGETLEGIARLYGVDPAVILAYPLNYLREPIVLQPGQKMVVPGGKRDIRLPKPLLSPNSPFAWPLWGQITQGYKAKHRAIDIGGPYDTPVYAARDGRVTFAGLSKVGYGYMVMLDHGNGLTTLYGHLSGDEVSVGQRVKRGQMIGSLGSTGKSTGPHLHFEIRLYGELQNPLDYLPSR